MKILVIEDDRLVADALVELFTHQTYAVEVAENGKIAWELLQTYEYDLVVLDLVLPDTNGIELCQRLRHVGNPVPILILTARNHHHDRALGLDAGADDYVVKPFDAEELMARVRALLRRGTDTPQACLTWGKVQLDPTACQVTYDGELIPLTPKEYALTELFLRNPKRVFSCSAILDHLWAYEEAPGEEAVRTHIKGLRQKLKATDPHLDMVETVYGIGYRLKTIALPSECPPETSIAPPDRAIDISTTMQVNALLQKIWQDAQERVQAQLEVIHQTIVALETGTFALSELLPLAIREAHTLAGSLGTFGLHEGSEIARKIKAQLESETPLSEPVLQQLRQDLTALQTIIQATRHTAPNHDSADPSPPNDKKRLLVITADPQILEQIQQQSALQTFHIEFASTLKQARILIHHQTPDLVLFDPDVVKQFANSLKFLQALHQRISPILPIVVFTNHATLLERRNLLRAGSSIFLRKPASPAQIFDALGQATELTQQSQSRVLVVDDDPSILALVQHLLQPWGITVTTLADPQQFWSILESVQPNLLILDVTMPEVTGLELCQLIRNDAIWSELPIVFLTADKAPTMVNQVFSLGADDFVAKPIIGPELVTRVVNRLERVRLIQQHAQQLPPNPIQNFA